MSTPAPHKPGEFGEPPAGKSGPGLWHLVRQILKPIASLKITVVLFALSMLLIFFGTIAQMDYGIWTVVDKYFWSWYVMVPFDLINKFLGVFWKEQFPPGDTWTGSFPLPGGKLLGGAMLINLVAAHAVLFGDFIFGAIKQSGRANAARNILVTLLKRTGIYLIHGGLLLLFVGEYITREYAVEQRMTIGQGESVNYTEDSRNVELAIVDHSDADKDHVVVIPQNLLKQTGRIKNEDLPFDVEVIEYMGNSDLEDAKKSNAPNPADSGLGKMAIAKKKPEVSGVDPTAQIDFPSAYLRLYKKGTDESIGTYLASLMFTMMPMGGEDKIETGGKTYGMSLRFKRYYKPYRVYLDKFSFDRYTGTQKAKNYSADVRVQDESGKDLFAYHIAMNEPLRYEGETFYQSSFDPRTEKTTILQVVKNPGWRLPYIACGVVGFGLLLHFLITLVPFLIRSAPARAAAAAGATPTAQPTTPADPEDYFASNALPTGPSAAARYLPYAVLGVVLLYLLSSVMRMTPPKEPVDLDAVGRMRIHDGGRVKPLDTYARVQLRMISGREEVVDDKGNKIPAIQWFLDTIATGNPNERGVAWEYKIFRIDNETVLRALELSPREGLRYSLKEIETKFSSILPKLAEIQKKIDAKQKLSTDESKFKELGDRIGLFLNIAALGGQPDHNYEGVLLLPPYQGEGWQSLRKHRDTAAGENLDFWIAEVRQTLAPHLAKLTDEQVKAALENMGRDPAKMTAEDREFLVKLLTADPANLPAEKAREMWLKAAFGVMSEEEKKQIEERRTADLKKRLETQPAASTWLRLIAAYREKRYNDFANEVKAYNGLTAQAEVPDTLAGESVLEKAVYAPFNPYGHNKVEITYNRFAPFYQCAGLYVLVFLLSLISFLCYVAKLPYWAKSLRLSAIYVVLVAIAIHFTALLTRMYIMDRAGVFVTNLYSSGIFISFMSVLLCLALEQIFRIGVANAIGGLLGVAATIVAHNVASDDTLEMMQAVLDTNFWLATHVTTISFGYAATFVAGFFGAVYVWLMTAAVIRDSYSKLGEPTVGDLLAFGSATVGVVGIPLATLAFAISVMRQFELLPGTLLWAFFGLVAACGAIYAITLMFTRLGPPVDAHGKPVAGQIPNIAKPVTMIAMNPNIAKTLGQIIYGVVCFATLLSFVGTVLGGIWADQSWGRFWGWDPKENGAVLIVLWNSLILHARWAGLVKDRGVAVLAVFGNVITAWSWFGTNQLGLGLHAYGFDSRLADGCFNFWTSQLFILGLGLIPQRFWSSVTQRVATSTAVAPVSAPNTTPTATAPQPNVSAPPASPNGNGVPHTNGHVNGQPNGQPNGHPRRDKKKRHGKK